MKKISLYTGLLAICALLATSCEKADLGAGVTTNKGLLNFSIAVPGQTTLYSARVAGPYNDGDTIYVEVPTTDDNPLDVTRLKAEASLENNAVLTPALGEILDFSSPLNITVKDGLGAIRHHVVKVLPTLPKTVFSKLWFKTAADLGVLRTNITGATVAGGHLLIADFNQGSLAADVGVRVYDKFTGAFSHIIAPPTTYCQQVTADDGGHFAVNRYNIYGAGFMLYYYETVNSAPKLILNYTNAMGAPVNLGQRVSIIGNLKEGKAYVYATCGSVNSFYFWEFHDGVPVSVTPTAVRFASANPWTYALVKRKSLDDVSDHYITYCNYVSPDANLANGSRFCAFPLDMNLTQMNTANHYYKILGFDVFDMHGDKFLALLQQGYAAWDATNIRVFEITDQSKLTMAPGAEGYNSFQLFDSDIYGGTNYNRVGDIVTDIIGNDVYFYATMGTNANTTANTTAGVMCYKMTYYPR
ncbi:MAG: hypothetical protein P0Y53_24385 [Candidatus Pseudobacter hemicellulosilyticus]|uniref:DUF5018 domain-containing protein n=1 Tax=Candidatus Pseudobacter hemicellulosilyticus TaxID=3121375 RepID=A0AAJ5WP99_9BACT|nr:MAG: hypothetical protein P0Y53_24385 [Pseudobacter sp.]